MYRKEDHIQIIQQGEKCYGQFKYRVMGRDNLPVHHTNSYEDAEWYFDKCKKSWEEKDRAKNDEAN